MYRNLLKTAILFYKLAQGSYDKYRHKIEELAAQNPFPFNEWFGENGRTYIDFEAEKSEEVDPEIEDFLEENGYTIIDYIGGYAENPDGRKEKIGKILNKLEKRDIEEAIAKAKKSLTGIYPEDKIEEAANRAKLESQLVYRQLRSIFANSEFRKGSKLDKMKIVFSQNPHDVAQMSTGRGWSSCMNLEGGEYSGNVYCEVAEGGLIAYLIKADDLDIEKPIARISIKRFVNSEGHSIAIPEARSYGTNIAGFYEAVKKWIEEKNQRLPGYYERKGGEYSDSLPREIAIMPESEQKLLNWLMGKDLPTNIKKEKWIVVDYYDDDIRELLEEEYVPRGKTFFNEEEAKVYIDDLKHNNWKVNEENDELMGYSYPDEDNHEEYEQEFAEQRFTIEHIIDDKTEDFRDALISGVSKKKLNLTDNFLDRFKEALFKNGSSEDISKFIQNYPNSIKEDDIGKISDASIYKIITLIKSAKLPENIKKTLVANLGERIYKEVEELTDEFSFANLNVLAKSEFTYTDFLSKEIAEKISDRIIKFIKEGIEEVFSGGSRFTDNQANDIRWLFDRTAQWVGNQKVINDIISDDMIDLYLKFIDSIYLRDHAHVLARSGERGKKLLPVLIQKRKVAEEMLAEPQIPQYRLYRCKVDLNILNYIIDSIESGEPSKKYNLYEY